jgi:outer membrane lipoprotein SlyB
VIVGYLFVFYVGIGVLMLFGAADGEQQGYLFVAVITGAVAGAILGSRLLPHVLGRGRPR